MGNEANKPVPVDRVILSFKSFAEKEASSGILLLIASAIALIWANSPWAEVYHHLWEVKFSIGFEKFSISKSLHVWINDGLMAMFFFVVGLEIKSEVIAGELSSLRHAAFPIMAAIGGMLVPALIYILFTSGGSGAGGWGIPMATDIAFALGIMALVGKGVPKSLKVFLTALAIADDLGAVLVIAFFYTSELSLHSLAIGGGFLVALIIANRLGIRNPLFYAIFGISGLWVAFLLSGVHPTIAGILSAFTIPARPRINSHEFLQKSKDIIAEFKQLDGERPDEEGQTVLMGERRLSTLLKLRGAYENASTPLQRLEKTLHPWVVFLVLPAFALANAGVSLEGKFLEVLKNPVAIGTILGLVIGKQVGILSFSWLAVRLGLGGLPSSVGWRHIYGVSLIGGVGFTMSLFIATLAFQSGPELLAAKAGILIASLISGLVGWAVLKKTIAS